MTNFRVMEHRIDGDSNPGTRGVLRRRKGEVRLLASCGSPCGLGYEQDGTARKNKSAGFDYYSLSECLGEE